MRIGLSLLAVLGLFSVSPAHATPVTIDFESLRVANAFQNLVGPTYSDSGYLFTALTDSGSAPDFTSFGTLHPNFSGSTALMHHISNGQIVLTKEDGAAFDFRGIDLVENPGWITEGVYPEPLGQTHLMFVGLRADGTTVSHDVEFAQWPLKTTLAFADFTNVLSVSWDQGPGSVIGGATHQFDNVIVEPVPEPATLVLVCVGLLAFSTRRGRVSYVRRDRIRVSLRHPFFG